MAKSNLKVFGWQGSRHGVGQTREICAAPSLAAIMRKHNLTRDNLFNVTETGNAREVNLATREMLVIYWKPLDDWARDDGSNRDCVEP